MNEMRCPLPPSSRPLLIRRIIRQSRIADALTKGIQAYQRDLTGMLYVTGAAMAPTLNARATTPGGNGSVEKLLVRWIPRPSARNVFVGDVVAFTSPLAVPDPDGMAEPHVMVRRVAASEGEEMVSDDPEDEPWRLAAGHCWVLADNTSLAPRDVLDSRSFGPLPYEKVLGRVLYSAAAPSRHGPIENSDAAAAEDGPVLAAELDAEEFSKDTGGSGASS